MKHWLRGWLFLSLFGILAASCSQKSDPAPAATPTTGTITGTVSPARAITQVTARTTGGLTFIATPDASTGAFTTPALAAGQYTLSFTMAPGYKSVADKTITVTAGQTASAGTVQAASDGTIKSGTMTWTVNGQTYTATALTGRVDRSVNRSFTVTGSVTNGNQVDELYLGLGTTFYGAGSYGYNTPYNSAAYRRIVGGLPTFDYNTSSSSIGTLVVTQYDEATGTLAGTFGFVAPVNSAGAGPSSATITNGSFTIRF